jgi:hypothetical protein
MIQKYLRENREKIFPDITDWTDGKDHIRNEKDVGKLSQMEWFWFHPTAYYLFHLAPTLFSMIIFSALGIWMGFRESYFLMALMFVVAAIMAREHYLKNKIKQYAKTITMFDVFMRDFPELEERKDD